MDMQPGQILTPQNNDPNKDAVEHPDASPAPQATLPPVQAAPAVASPQTMPEPQPQAQDMQQSPPSPVSSPQTDGTHQDAGWQYDEDENLPDTKPLPEDVRWTSAEFVEHPKGASWYGMLAVAAVVIAGIDYLFTKDWFSAVIIVVAAAMFGVYAGHKPRIQNYLLSPDGLQIGERTYTYQTFKAFSVAEEGTTISIMFMPLARFAAPLTIYVTSDVEDKVVDYLVQFLPFEQRRADAVDGLLRRIKF